MNRLDHVSRSARPVTSDSVDAAVEATLERVGRRIVLGTPLALGKPNHLVNAFYRRAAADPSIHLTVYTALTLAAPRWSSELERRMVEPLNARLFAGYPEIDWVEPLRRGELPDNIEIREFYFQPGAMLSSPSAQRSYIASNYTHVVRDVLAAGINVIAQAVGAEEVDGELRYSLSCNSDLSVDLLPRLREREREGKEVAVLAQVNRNLPFMFGDAMVPPETFDFVVDRPELELPLFAPPNEPIDTTDYLIATHVSALIRDGGTLQVGIGSLGDAIVRLLQVRHEDNGVYREVLDALDVHGRCGDLIERWGGTGPFERGLYAATEMLVDGFLALYRSGILKRRVYPHAALQRLLDAGRLPVESSDQGDVVPAEAYEECVEILMEEGGVAEPEARDLLGEPGKLIPGGRLAHSCFFLGPESFYEGLRSLPRAERELIEMTGISFVNELYGTAPGEEDLKRAQRRHARFVNTAMKMTLLGAAVSDGLEDGRVVSGVGGQYNFVAMAHELDEGRSVLMVRSTREHRGELTSNVVWSYGHVTIPRHLKDLVVTEYGVADLRGKTDEEVVAALLSIADSRFQEELLEQAKRSGKIADDYRIPDRYRQNLPERLEDALAPFREEGHFEEFPFGTDLTDEEVVLLKALRGVQERLERRDLSLLPGLDEVRALVDVPEAARPYLERMDLAEPEGFEETLLQRAVVYALVNQDLI